LHLFNQSFRVGPPSIFFCLIVASDRGKDVTKTVRENQAIDTKINSSICRMKQSFFEHLCGGSLKLYLLYSKYKNKFIPRPEMCNLQKKVKEIIWRFYATFRRGMPHQAYRMYAKTKRTKKIRHMDDNVGSVICVVIHHPS
jgi:hypothetical protein